MTEELELDKKGVTINTGSAFLDKAISLVNHVGFPIAVVGYFLYKDWIFTRDLITNQTQIILLQTQIVQSIDTIAKALVK